MVGIFVYLRRLLFFAANMTFFASRRFLVFLELDFWRLIQLPRFAMGCVADLCFYYGLSVRF